MTDIALAAAPVLTPATGAPVAATGIAVATVVAGEAASDPFAALLASLAPSPDSAATPVPTPNPAAIPATITLLGATAKTPALATTTDEQLPVIEHDGDQPDDQPGDDDTADRDQGDDPQLAMMLAIATPAPVPMIVLPTNTKPVAATAASDAAVTLPTKAPVPAPAKGADDVSGRDVAPSPDTHAAPASAAAPLHTSRFATLAARLMGSTIPTHVDAPKLGPTAAQSLAAQKADATQPQSPVPAQPASPQIIVATKPSTSEAPRAAVTIDEVDRKDASASDPTGALFGSPATQRAAITQDVPVASTRAPDTAIHRELSMARDGQWLDTLARDIVATAGKDGQMSFRLDPHHLGSLTVHISHSDEGASVRMSADTEAARQMLSDAQPRFAAEARAQGLHLRETSVDMGGSGAGQSGQQGAASTFASFAQGQSQRNSGGDQTFINLTAGEADEPARTSPTSARSDLYA